MSHSVELVWLSFFWAARQPATTRGRAKSMQRNVARGGARLNAHETRSPRLYLQSLRMYFVVLQHCGRPRAQTPSNRPTRPRTRSVSRASAVRVLETGTEREPGLGMLDQLSVGVLGTRSPSSRPRKRQGQPHRLHFSRGRDDNISRDWVFTSRLLIRNANRKN